ncbi:intracellular growth attenuator family protein [Salinimonas lutimaris]|uniref:intracellular growth attenuator family protein n=1 Tax=Salinimonas lutimaris TaxID=914153 RepID=UPI0010C0834C|nr:intracellular growth attenuator family protein [Salinimonas lutimaris]
MQPDEYKSPTSVSYSNNVTPMFNRRQVRLHDSQVSEHGLEQRWNKRLRKLLKAERSLHRANRLRAISNVIIVAAALTLCFSLYVAPVMSPWVFITEVLVLAGGLILLPISVLVSRECQRHRDGLSRRFYESNHEVEYTESALVLIDRSTYTSVTRVPTAEL